MKDRLVIVCIVVMGLLLWTGTSVTSLAGIAGRAVRAIQPHVHLPNSLRPSKSLGTATVERVSSGDQLRLTDGRTVRLAQIDTPDSGQCGAAAAKNRLARLLPPGSPIELQSEPANAARDAQGRTLAYVVVTRAGSAINLNLALVRAGLAQPLWESGNKGVYAAQLTRTAQRASAAGAGVWGACPRARLDASGALQTGPAAR